MTYALLAFIAAAIGYGAGRSDLRDLGRLRHRAVPPHIPSGDVVRMLRVVEDRDGVFVPDDAA